MGVWFTSVLVFVVGVLGEEVGKVVWDKWGGLGGLRW